MTRIEFDKLASDGRVPCPDCGGTHTRPYPNCGCPRSGTGYGTMHINKWHHACKSVPLKPGWLNRQFEKVEIEVQDWPDWMKREAGLGTTKLIISKPRRMLRLRRVI